MKQQLANPGQYLVRILSAGNYVQGEERIRIFGDVTPNQIIYQKMKRSHLFLLMNKI